jgi:1-acyl-sn-glycerol-3-phosphate acyltransferase
MRKTLLFPFQLLYVIYALLAFVVLMISVFIWSLMVLPAGRLKAGNLIYKACMLWADCWLLLVFIRHKNIYVDGGPPQSACIYVSNHISYMDSAIVPKAIRRPIRPLGKVEMARIPVFGLIYKNVIVSVDRSSSGNRTKSVQQLKALLRKGISILVFPEGTFNMTHEPLKEFYDGAFRIALETGTPIQPMLLMNTFDRMHYHSIFSLNPGKSEAIFLPLVPVEGLTGKQLPELKEKVRSMMEDELVRRNATWIFESQNSKVKSQNKKVGDS